MSRNGSGVYSLPAGNPVVTGTTISSSWANTTLSDIATALTGSVAADGQTPMTGNLQMGGNKVTGLGAATASGQALSYGQNLGAIVGTSVTDSGLTSGRVTYATTAGLLTDSANLTFDGTNLTLGGGTANGVLYLNGSKVATSGSGLVFDGTKADNSTRLKFRYDGADQALNFGVTTVGTSTSASTQYYYLGVDDTGSAGYWQGDMGSLIVYTRALNTNEIVGVETYLLNFWGI